MPLPKDARLIDSLSGPNDPKPVKILCLGMCRTGTSSLLVILERLGYSPTHMTRLLEDPLHKRMWIEAIERNFLRKTPEGKKPYGRAEFDILLDGYDVVLDVPYAIFAEHLIRAYPHAKVILTTRPVEEWIQSMQATVWQNVQWPSYRILRWIEPEFLGSFVELVEKIFLAHNGGRFGGSEAEQAYLLHNQRVRELVPKERLSIPPHILMSMFVSRMIDGCERGAADQFSWL
ncbi:P-loop containing nucleoside triphosphate hydrolase protein [Aspergillus terreus]|uniref:P-loop containing nucleoside triphosphate hydrolase protein n=1 Tax=Aspergillus terreus TaxID=33178 RepID=A0A5M3YVN3_ASPTE|nr:hypothetical protein ATETN484_0005001900 [Aspergillus terreus]GFF16686.1 P-loop containing nucleoside triphosphate hydrolase protein [Aspergillus terreus]